MVWKSTVYIICKVMDFNNTIGYGTETSKILMDCFHFYAMLAKRNLFAIANNALCTRSLSLIASICS